MFAIEQRVLQTMAMRFLSFSVPPGEIHIHNLVPHTLKTRLDGGGSIAWVSVLRRTHLTTMRNCLFCHIFNIAIYTQSPIKRSRFSSLHIHFINTYQEEEKSPLFEESDCNHFKYWIGCVI